MNAELKKLCKFYQGENSCPYNQDTQRNQYMFWFYEKKFEHEYFEGGLHKGKDLDTAFKDYLSKLFPALADKYGSMDDGTLFQEIYERLEP